MLVDLVDLAGEAVPLITEAGQAVEDLFGSPLDGEAVDLLWTEDRAHVLSAERVDTQHTHGTGCVLSAAITARLANGEDLVTAVKSAKRFITAAIQTSPGLGHGFGPVNMHSRTDF